MNKSLHLILKYKSELIEGKNLKVHLVETKGEWNIINEKEEYFKIGIDKYEQLKEQLLKKIETKIFFYETGNEYYYVTKLIKIKNNRHTLILDPNLIQEKDLPSGIVKTEDFHSFLLKQGYNGLFSPRSIFLYIEKKLVNSDQKITEDYIEVNPLIQLLGSKKQIILYGPPGTGKTHKTKEFSVSLLNIKNG